MKRSLLLAAFLAACALASLHFPRAAAQPAAPPGGRPPALDPDSLAAARDSLMNDVLARIAGRESAPAESVFKDIQILKGVPAGRLLRIMNMGYARSLGVGCDHCHTVGEWEKSDKPKKQVARDMSRMVGTINNDLLGGIKNLESEKPVVNCTTCHRGDRKPATNL